MKLKLFPYLKTEMEWVARNGQMLDIIVEQSWWRQTP